MIPTFSINIDPYKKMHRVSKLTLNPLTEREQEWLSEAYIKIIEDRGKNSENINLKAYSAACHNNAKLARMSDNTVSVLTNSELTEGHSGITELVAQYVEENIDTILDNLDIDYFVNSFLDMREYVYLEEGKDIWRLLELSRKEDMKALKKLRGIISQYDYLKELIEYILKTPDCYSKLEGLLC